MAMSFDVPLTPEEFAALQEVGKGITQGAPIPAEHRARLIELGLIRENVGGLCITGAGSMRIAIGK
jgi:hypothetical protein